MISEVSPGVFTAFVVLLQGVSFAVSMIAMAYRFHSLDEENRKLVARVTALEIEFGLLEAGKSG